MTLSLINVTKRINRQTILDNITLEVLDKECLAILGPSGCGKSTTLRIIAGLEDLDAGKIYINNKDVTNVSPVKRKVGMVFQSYALFPHLTVKKNLSVGMEVRKINSTEIQNRIMSVLSVMQLDHLANRLPSQLSGGQKQRVALARALLRDPSVYLLDEPMSNLDAQLRDDLRPMLKNVILEGTQPIVYVTHDQQEAMAMANKIAVLNEGKVEQVGTPQELYLKPISKFVAGFIGRPQINFFNKHEKC